MKHVLCVLTALLAASAHAEPLLSLIDIGGRERDPNRALPFAEFRDVGGRAREYSVPFVTDLQVRNVATNLKVNWNMYQETMWWNRQAALNATLLSSAGLLDAPIKSLYQNGAWCSLLPDGADQLAPNPDEIDITTTPDVTQNAATQFDRPATLGYTPPIPTATACQNVTATTVSDEIPLLGTAYMPATRLDFGGGVIVDLFSNPWPFPDNFNWESVMQRTDAACTSTTTAASQKYQLDSAAAVKKFLPLSIDWNGTLAWDATQNRSGTTFSPYFGTDPAQYAKSLADVIAKNPQFGQYYTRSLTSAQAAGYVAADIANKQNTPGLSPFEALKTGLYPGTMQDQEKHGYASLFQTWQTMDIVEEPRPSTYTGVAYYIAVTFLGPATTPIPIELPAPAGLVTPLGCTHVPTPTVFGTGTSTITAPRYHWGFVNVAEGFTVPNTLGTPVRIGTEE